MTKAWTEQFAFRPGRRRKEAELRLMKMVCVIFVFCVATAIGSLAKTTFTTLASFDNTNGWNPEYMSLVQGANGDFYGTTFYGGAYGGGEVFKIDTTGTLNAVYSFVCSQTECPDGERPYAGLALGTNADFYGTTSSGGANNGGTVFKITPGGTLTTLYSFCAQTSCADGDSPWAGLVLGANGDFYGTTLNGGANSGGTIFKITTGGKLTTLYSFCAQTNCTDGLNSIAAPVQATNGDFYGTTQYGGASVNCPADAILGCGTVFKITPAGKLTTLYSFCAQKNCTDGFNPYGGLVQGTDGNLYGTTAEGGNVTCGAPDGCGSVFKITTGGKLTTLHSFDGMDGDYPLDRLIQATDGNFYGTASNGGNLTCDAPDGCGTVFKITPGGRLTTLYSFDGTGGVAPYGGVVQGTNGKFYGTTPYGGAYCAGQSGCGVVFSLSVGLHSFVETLPTIGKVGAMVKILGSSLTGATSVSFNGTPQPAFTVVSKSEITTTVPAGATTGTVEVITPSGSLTSNMAFGVTP